MTSAAMLEKAIVRIVAKEPLRVLDESAIEIRIERDLKRDFFPNRPYSWIGNSSGGAAAAIEIAGA